MAKRLIYAEDVLEILDRDKAYMSDVGRIHARNAVNEAPTVDAKTVVHGRWWDVALRYTEVKEECSVCHCVVRVHGFRYCPNCGANMEGERRTDNERKAD